ncbi:hypothetical protein IJG14_06280 [bacterium]|nr:hypothetical protein [bacterium]
MNQNNITIYPMEKIIAVLSYFTWGFVGLVYLIIAVFRKQGLRSFLRYHVFMSIFISILIFIVSQALILVINILGYIPVVKAVVLSVTVMMQSDIFSVFGLHFSIISIIVYGLLTYLSVGAILGKYSYLPWISEVINYNMHK